MSSYGLIAHFILALNNNPLSICTIVYSPTKEYVGCLKVLAIMNKAAIYNHVQSFVWIKVLSFFEIPSSVIAGTDGENMVRFVKQNKQNNKTTGFFLFE
jgi:hypothetical protein